MKLAAVSVLFAIALAGQEKPAEKPDPIRKARELLDGAAEMMGGMQPQVQVAGLWHVAENYQAFDRKKALEFYKQAWAGVPMLPPEQLPAYRSRLQVEIVRSVADVDVNLAMELLKQMPASGSEYYDNRLFAIQKMVQVLVEKGELDKAMTFLDAMGGLGAYSFRAAIAVFRKLAPDDPRRTWLFGSAVAAFNLRPYREFSAFLADCAKEVSPNAASAALGSYLNFILGQKDEPVKTETGTIAQQTTTYVTPKGVVALNTPQERDLFDVMWLVREIEPKRAEEILQKYPVMKSALEAYPKGTESMQRDGAMYTFSTVSSEKNMESQRFVDQFRARAVQESRVMEAMALAVKDPDRALDVVRSVAAPAKQAEILAAVARSVAEKDPAKSRHALNKCIEAMAEIKDPGERIAVWDAVAESASLIHDDKLLWEAIDKGLSDAAALYKLDSEDARANVRVQEFWPSTLAYRRMVMRATRILKTDAEPLLQKIGDPGINLMARIAMAQALLGREIKQWPAYVPQRRTPAKR